MKRNLRWRDTSLDSQLEVALRLVLVNGSALVVCCIGVAPSSGPTYATDGALGETSRDALQEWRRAFGIDLDRLLPYAARTVARNFFTSVLR
jgi:hypothetical protein